MSLRRFAAWVLWPFTMWYGVGVTIRNLLFDIGVKHQVSLPVTSIGIGNLAVGGTGKTPLADYLISLFSDTFRVSLVSRGYKRKSKGCVICSHEASVPDNLPELLGDETAMLFVKHQNISAAVCKSRAEAVDALMSLDNPPQLVILDDIFQHRHVKPTISILLTDYNHLFSDDRVLPYGNLREPKSSSRRANVVIVTKTPYKLNSLEKKDVYRRLRLKPYQKLFFSGISYGAPVKLFENTADCNFEIVKHIVCVTGIANPEPLLSELRQHGRHVEHISFPDHHDFTNADIDCLVSAFEAIDSPSKIILTTEKDSVRLRSCGAVDVLAALPVYFLPMAIFFQDESGYDFDRFISASVRENISFLDRLTKSGIS